MSFFTVHHQSSKSRARLGSIQTDHGTIQTPAFVPVGTKGTIKGLTQEQIKNLHVQLSFVNTYHLVTHPGVEVLQSAGGVHKYAHYSIPLMSDSGGFQVFSLAQRQKEVGIKEKNSAKNVMRGWIPASAGMTNNMVGMTNNMVGITNNKRIGILRATDTGLGTLATPFDMKEQPLVEKISEDGVLFRSVYDGQLINFTPETSMDFQRIIGADINMAFDECTYYSATHEYAEKAMERTHEWLKRCIAQSKNITLLTTNYQLPTTIHQFLYGIIQGGTYEDLRKKSAEFVVAQNTPGVAIGGVSVGETKEEMRKQVEWVAPYLPVDRPVHLLGVGHIDDIVDLVKYGIDTFDCVEPTRVARMGTAYQTEAVMAHLEGKLLPYEIDVKKMMYKTDLSPLDALCSCSTCVNYSKSYLHHLFKQRELLGYTLLSYHNLFVMERVMERIKGLVQSGRV